MVLSADRIQSLDHVIANLSPTEQEFLRSGKAIVNTVGNRYVSYVVSPTDVDKAWDVLTDYNNFAKFLPSVTRSQVLEDEGDRAVVEQVAQLKVLMAEMSSRIRTENIKTPKERIDFHLVDGDLEMMKGYWQLIPVRDEHSDSEGEPKTVIKQSVEAKVGNPLLEGAFEAVYTNNMKKNLAAIAREARNR